MLSRSDNETHKWPSTGGEVLDDDENSANGPYHAAAAYNFTSYLDLDLATLYLRYAYPPAHRPHRPRLSCVITRIRELRQTTFICAEVPDNNSRWGTNMRFSSEKGTARVFDPLESAVDTLQMLPDKTSDTRILRDGFEEIVERTNEFDGDRCRGYREMTLLHLVTIFSM
ncbi:hypothetical protein NP233_g68 [Leucocoprinus birnbaumii]|uniref:Uncharacterized protein n=1 Tax=Leucocoprinus birnbaumii TaxID=56174 RepID=A0AAD5W4A0_9AGAR|nr:hypothetical protein NP233_g68 [Leucocoprinus birnbaumii]